MKKKSTSESAFFNLRVLIGMFVLLAGVFLALLGFGTFSAQAQQNYTTTNSIDPLVPAGFDCSKIHELGIDKQENLRAGAIMIFCGLAKGGGAPSHFGPLTTKVIQNLMAPLAYGAADVDLITGLRPFPKLPNPRNL